MKSLRRSNLAVLGDSRDEMELAAKAGADIVQMTVEDGVPSERKDVARSMVAAALLEIEWNQAERWIKINGFDSGETAKDVDVIAAGRPDAFVLAQTGGPEDIVELAGLIERAEEKYDLPRESIAIVAIIERVRALSQVEDIAQSHPRVTSLEMGFVDLATEYGYRLDLAGPSFETLYARSRCVLAARLAGIDICDMCYLFSNDLPGALRSTLWSLQFGFTTKVTHAAIQIPTIHAAFDLPVSSWQESADAGWAKIGETQIAR